jgi:hypothetical protein
MPAVGTVHTTRTFELEFEPLATVNLSTKCFAG